MSVREGEVAAAWELLNGGKVVAARDAFLALSAGMPGDHRVVLGLSECHMRLNDPVAAERCLREYGATTPALQTQLAFALQIREQWAEAEHWYRAALAEGGDQPRARLGLGVVLMKLGRMDEAQEILESHLRLCPGDGHAWVHLAALHRAFGRMAPAFAAYRNGLAVLDPGDRLVVSAHCELALTALSLGDYSTGFAELEWRLDSLLADYVAVMRAAAPPWEGVVARGRRLLLWCEQGLGDVIHFARYAQLLGGLGMLVHLLVPPQLVRLARTIPNVHGVHVGGDVIPAVDFQAPLLSVPHLLRLGGRGLSIPRQVPYLFPDAAEVELWRARLDQTATGRRRIGLVWAGNPAFGLDSRRTLDLDTLAPILRVPGNAFYSLQLGNRAPAEQLAAHGIVDLAGHIGDYADTAAAMQALDMVISVDTSTVHCAGALGKPTWLPLYSPPDWRWGLNGDETIWYPTIRLFRQTVQGRWDDVVQSMAAALAALETRT